MQSNVEHIFVVWWYLEWLPLLPLCSRFLLLAPSAQQPPHFPPRQSILTADKEFNIKSKDFIFKVCEIQDQKLLSCGVWQCLQRVFEETMEKPSDLQETPECSIPWEDGTASPSPRSLYGASVSAGRWFQHLQEKCVTACTTPVQAQLTS